MICPNGHEHNCTDFDLAPWKSDIKYFICPECKILFRPPIASKGEIGVVVRKPKEGAYALDYGPEEELLPYTEIELELKKWDNDNYLKILRVRASYNYDICGMCKNKKCEVNGGTEIFFPHKDNKELICEGLRYSDDNCEECA